MSAIQSGRHPDDALEMFGEVALVRKAYGERGVNARYARPQQLFGAQNPRLDLVSMGRKIHLPAERAQQMERTELGQCGKLGQRDILGVVLIEIRAHMLDASMLFGRRADLRAIVGIAHDQARQGPQEARFALQSRGRALQHAVREQNLRPEFRIIHDRLGEERQVPFASNDIRDGALQQLG